MNTEPSQGVTITLKDVYDSQQHLSTEMTKILTFIEVATKRDLDDDNLHKDYETRLRALEKWRYALPTSIALTIISIALAVYSASVHK